MMYYGMQYPNRYRTGLDRRDGGAGWGTVLAAGALVGVGVFAYFMYRNVWAGLGPLRGARRALFEEGS